MGDCSNLLWRNWSQLNHAVNNNQAQGSGVVWSFSGSSATNVIDTKVATKDPPSLAQPRAFSTHSSPEGWYERSGASPCSVLTASMAQVTGDPPYTTLAASHTRGFGREHT